MIQFGRYTLKTGVFTTNLLKRHSFLPYNGVNNGAFRSISEFGGLQNCYTNTRGFSQHVIRVPSLGDSITEGDVCEWKKKVGDFIHKDQVLCVIETDKVSVEIHADVDGTLVSQVVAEGETALVGGDLALIDTDTVDNTSTKLDPPSVESANSNVKNAKNMKKYVSSIRFKYGLLKSNPVTREVKQDTVANTIDLSTETPVEIPDEYQTITRKLLSETEIEIVNLGGDVEWANASLGKWVTKVELERPRSNM